MTTTDLPIGPDGVIGWPDDAPHDGTGRVECNPAAEERECAHCGRTIVTDAVGPWIHQDTGHNYCQGEEGYAADNGDGTWTAAEPAATFHFASRGPVRGRFREGASVGDAVEALLALALEITRNGRVSCECCTTPSPF